MKDIRFAKFVVFVNAGVPLALLAWDASQHRLGANPVNFAIRTTGMLTLVFLSLSLVVTPVRKITGWNWLIFFRRTLGLYAFFYGCVHFLLFFSLDRSLSVSGTLSEMLKRKYLVVGATGLLLMAPLAATSTNAMIKRLGATRWRKLHRLVYAAAIAGVIHYYMLVKADVRQPLAFAGALAVLLGFRLIVSWRRARPVTAAAVKPKIWSGPLQVTRIVQETPEVRTFRLASPDGGRRPFDHLPGQYLILSLQIGGKKVVRTYTIASSPARPDYCEVTIKREESGLASCHLHDRVREGDQLSVSAPAGRFTFDGTQSDSIVLIGGGVGITPLMSILRHIIDRRWTGEIFFLYCAKTPEDIIFRRELDDLQRRFPNLHLLVTITRAAEQEWTGPRGRITGELLTQTVPHLAARPVYVCGPTSMIDATIQSLQELGVPKERIKFEAFVAAKRTEAALALSDANAASLPATAGADWSTTPAGDPGVPQLNFARSAKSAPLDPEKSLLEISEAAGLNPDFECRSGICGRCKTRLLAGAVTMEVQDALDDADRSDNIILLCQARSTGPVTIEA
ncbi:MAG TPA: ferric reductase-like transmembrane domain-containing protein [Opitutaceae bacterium]|nr:ferric reductase-like transmembrane domain-containing protein [Opitutaceae bacterium]